MQDRKKKLWKLIIAGIVLAVGIVIAFPFIKPIRVTWSSLPYEYTIYGTYIEINRYIGNESEVIIPDEICFRPVTDLRPTEELFKMETYGEECVFTDSTITSVYIPDTVKSIGECCFLRCSNLTEVHLSSSIKEISSDTFKYCSALESIVIPEGVEKIGSGAFCGCYSLKEVSLPQSLKAIANNAFVWCEQLSYIEIPEGVEKIHGTSFRGTAWEATWGDDFVVAGKNVLLYYAGDERKVEIPEGVEYIGSWALEDCTNVEQLILPESVKECDDYIITNNGSLKYIVVKNPNMIFMDGEPLDSRSSSIPAPTIVAEKGSTAEAYAKENGYPFLESIPEE